MDDITFIVQDYVIQVSFRALLKENVPYTFFSGPIFNHRDFISESSRIVQDLIKGGRTEELSFEVHLSTAKEPSIEGNFGGSIKDFPACIRELQEKEPDFEVPAVLSQQIWEKFQETTQNFYKNQR